MRVLGVDPGSVTTGYGLVEDRGSDLQAVAFGAITSRARAPFAQRLLRIYRELRAVIARHRPDCAAVESVFFAANAESALRLGQARGVVLLAIAEEGIEIAEYSPRAVKQAVTGYGQAEKSQVQEMVRLLLRLPEAPRPADTTDALALAICHHQAARLAARLPER
ncbi:MAG: crossover junction endodeoxyribonuclease RuvC [Candidatus Methylomirabilota bacterium]